MTSFERRIIIMNILYKRKYEITENLANELNVSARTIRRDIVELSMLIPLYTKTGRYGGGIYILDRCR